MVANYEWIIVGGGIAGIAVAEILTREGHSVLLLEQAPQLAGASTGDMHEWIHTGCLYTLLPDRLITVKYLLGAIDDLLEYYASFPHMNAVPTESGLAIGAEGWFEANYIYFRYRNRRFNPAWALCTARSRFLIERIARHDWLRRRAGVFEELRDGYWPAIWTHFCEQIAQVGRFFEVRSTDFTGRSRRVLQDLLAAALANGLEVQTSQRVREIRDELGGKRVITDSGTFAADRVVLCAGKAIADFVPVNVTTSYAPMAVVGGLPETARSFVELDLNTKNCINLLVKGNGLALVGGISLQRREDCDAYLDYVIRRHREYEPSLTVLGRYTGVKSEITFPKQDRNYLFHIVACGDNLWAIIPGKFILGFSLAPEFYRRVYQRNPRKFFIPSADTRDAAGIIAEARWQVLARKAAGDRAAAVDTPQAGDPAPMLDRECL